MLLGACNPNRHDMTLLPDGKTLLAVLRLDGGDGGPGPPAEPYHYLPYHRSVSTVPLTPTSTSTLI